MHDDYLLDHYLRTGNLFGAIEVLRRQLSQDPDDATAHALLALVLLDTKRLSAAAAEAGIAMALAPTYPLSLRALAAVRLAQARNDEAAEIAQQYRVIYPEDPDAWRLAAQVADAQRARAKRVEYLEHALTLDPEDPRILADLSYAAWEVRDAVSSRMYAEQAMRAAADASASLLAMGNVLLREGDVKGARAMAVEVLRSDPSNSAAIVLLSGVKARESWVLGLWWRYNAWMLQMGEARGIAILVGAFVVYRFVTQLSTDLGNEGLSGLIELIWLGLCAYTWFGPAWFKRQLDKELGTIHLDESF
jgi:tetratricopeptide (TPR) repeat protein